MKHQRFQTVRTHLICGKCSNKWYTKGYLVKETCPKCKHEDKIENIL